MLILFSIVFFNAVGVVVGYFGGYVGGSLADRQVSVPDHGSVGAEEP